MKSLFFLSQFYWLRLHCSAKEKTVSDSPFFKVAEMKEIKALSTNKQKNSIFYLWADWCPPCKKLGPIYKKVAKELSIKNIVFYTVDVGKYRTSKVAKKYEAQSLPTLLLFNDEGLLLKKTSRYRSYRSLMDLIKKTFKE